MDGLLAMRERVEAVGGTLQVRSAPGAGTEIEARFPLAAREAVRAAAAPSGGGEDI